jgi:hypothetical protein
VIGAFEVVGHFDPGLKCRLKKDGWYIGGEITGVVAMALLTRGMSAGAEGAALVADAAEAEETFYSVQGTEDVARLMRGGKPWPTGDTGGSLRDAYGQGLYTFASRADADSYMAKEGDTLCGRSQ